tara:strand:- start:151 stop:669 length:519 start_codon:yes stop_codon:yes gene_type:complete
VFAQVQNSDSESSSDSEESDNEDVQLKSAAGFNSWLVHDDPEPPKEKPYPHWMDGFGGYHTYKRDIPDRFESEADDTLMKSLYKNYATEGESGGKPNGHFWVTEADAKRVAAEVAETHLGQKGEAADSYVAAQFMPLWKKYDVNEDGKIEIDRMPTLLRTFCGSAEGCAGLQ